MNVPALLPWIAPLLALFLALLALMVSKPKIWMGTVLLTLPAYLVDVAEGVNAVETIMGAFYTFSIILWLVFRALTNPRPLLQGWMDFLIVFFIVASAFNVVIAALNDVDMFGWLVDWSYSLLILFYFPMREIFGTDTRSFKQLMVLCGITSITMALYGLWIFKQRMAEFLVFAFQIFASRSTLLGTVYLLVLCIAIIAFFHVKWSGKLLTLIVILTNTLAMIITFTRTIWVLIFVCIAISMLFLHVRQNVSILSGLVLTLGAVLIVLFSYNPKIGEVGLKLAKDRISTSTQLKGGDFSFETRVIEAENVWRQIKKAPLGGYGLRSEYVTWDPIIQNHRTVSFVHIGYLGLIHRLGFPIAIILFIILIGFSIKSFMVAVRSRRSTVSPIVKAVAIGIFSFIPALFINIFMAGIFDQRQGNFVFAFVFAGIAICDELIRTAAVKDSVVSN